MNTTDPLVGATVQIQADVPAFDCQTTTLTEISAGCILNIEAFEPRDPAAYAHSDGYLVWLITNECNDPQEDMQPDRWYIADAEQLVNSLT